MSQGFSSGDAWYRSALWTLIRARARRLLFAYAAVILAAVLLVKLYEAAPAEPPRSLEPTALPATPQLVIAASPSATSTRTVPTSTARPTTTIVPTPTPTIAQRWQVTERELDPHWQKDWPQVQQILERFLQQYPGFDPAREKLSVAFYEWGQQLRDGGQRDEAAEKFRAALELRPDFTLARNALIALTPTPVPTATPIPAPTATPVPPPTPRPQPQPTQPPRCQITLEASATNVPANTYVTFTARANRVLPKLTIAWGWQDGSACENCSTHTFRYNYQNYVGPLNFTGYGVRDNYVIMTECSTQTVKVTWYLQPR